MFPNKQTQSGLEPVPRCEPSNYQPTAPSSVVIYQLEFRTANHVMMTLNRCVRISLSTFCYTVMSENPLCVGTGTEKRTQYLHELRTANHVMITLNRCVRISLSTFCYTVMSEYPLCVGTGTEKRTQYLPAHCPIQCSDIPT